MRKKEANQQDTPRYRVIRNWFADGTPLVYRYCPACECYKVVATEFSPSNRINMCRDCYAAYKREWRQENERQKQEQRQETGTCKSCRSFSAVSSYAAAPATGWCLRHRRTVYARSCCAYHQLPRQGEYQQEAIATR